MLEHTEQHCSAEEQQRHYAVVKQVIEYLVANAHQQPTLAEIASAVHLSEFHLQRVFAAWAGLTPKRFLQYLTKEHAKRSLLASESILDTTMQTGLSSPGRLHDLLVSCEAMTPGEIKRQGEGLVIGYGVAPSCLGMAFIAWTPRGICKLAFFDDDEQPHHAELCRQWPAATLQRDDGHAISLADTIFSATPTRGKLHLVLQGTNFQLKVWEALINTEPAQRLSYRQLASLAGSPKASRAVGSAMAANAIGYLIPCHRVIRETGDVGHYRWGTSRKLAIQLWESAQAG